MKGGDAVTLEAKNILLLAGENIFTAYAFNRDNIKSEDEQFTVTGAESLGKLRHDLRTVALRKLF